MPLVDAWIPGPDPCQCENLQNGRFFLGGLSTLKHELHCRFIRQVRGDTYPVQAAALWAIELAYDQAWQLRGQVVQPYDEFADRWGNAVLPSM